MEKLNLNKDNLRKFGDTMFIALAVIGTILLMRHKQGYIWFYLAGTTLFLAGLLAANLLKPIYILWMRFAFILAWINTHIILTLIFYLVITPFGLGMRLFKVDLLRRNIEKGGLSYWNPKEKKKFNPVDYERLF